MQRHHTWEIKLQARQTKHGKTKTTHSCSMAEYSKIEWTDHTLNFWMGCRKVSPGCKYCYMYRDMERFDMDASTVTKVKEQTINKVLKAAQPGDKIFVCSWSDFFIEEADQWRAEAWKIIKSRPDLHFQILTKRAERIENCLPSDWGTGYPNVWLGVSIESQDQIKRLEILSEIPAKVRFISAEPLIGNLRLYDEVWISYLFETTIHWLIVGGESGNDTGKWKYRVMRYNWVLDLINDSKKARVPIFVKQLGTALSKQLRLKDRHGKDIEEWAARLQQRQFPKYYEFQRSKRERTK